MSSLLGPVLRRFARLFVRGPEAPQILDDLEEAMRRDLERGLSPSRARWRYLGNTVASGVALAVAQLGRLRGLSPFHISLLDVKLGLRMLFKHPGLTVVAVFALALGIPAALWPFQMVNIFQQPLPFEDGERIVGLRHREVARFEVSPGTQHELRVWRESLSSFETLGAASSAAFNVIAEDGRAEPWRGARMTASSFDIVRIAPLLGRTLLASDESSAAPDVAVISYQLWQSFLKGDPGILGKSLRIGDRAYIVVGVMPDGFRFPVSDDVWVPLRRDPAEAPARGEVTSVGDSFSSGEGLWIYGRLADGVSERRAQEELNAIERGLDEAFPEVYEPLRPEVVPFTFLIMNEVVGLKWVFLPFQLVAVVLLAVACGNVGTLILARTAARSGEVAVRTALGASRGRIVSQLFVESLLLALLATGLGLGLGEVAARVFARTASTVWSGINSLPFWIDFGPNRRTAAQALALAVFSAVIAGVLPALKATGRSVQSNLQRSGAGRSGIRFGHATTALIVAEVALGVACLFASSTGYRLLPRMYAPPTEIPVEQFLSARLRVSDRSFGVMTPAELRGARERAGAVHAEVVRRLGGEPGVRGVALAQVLPGEPHVSREFEVEGNPAEPAALVVVKRAGVELGFFEGLGVSMLSGRDFSASDLDGDTGASTAVIVNTDFVERVLHGGNPIGRRLRVVPDPRVRDVAGLNEGPWMQIVGIVPELGMLDVDGETDRAGLYQLVAPGAFNPMDVAIHVDGDPLRFVARLRTIVAEIDPTAVISETVPLAEIMSADRQLFGWVFFGVAVIAGVAVLLSVASLYALMSFTVAQRTHEIGIRSALGANASDIMTVVARRALLQLAAGVGIAVTVSASLLTTVIRDGRGFESWPLTLGFAAGTVLVVGLIACIVPTRRGLKIRPMDAMRL